MKDIKTHIQRLISNQGKYIVKKDRVIQGYIEDALANYPLYKNISIFLAKEGLLKNLGNTKKLNETELKTYTKQITDKYGTESEKTEETITAWAEALGVFVPEKKQKTVKTSSRQTKSNTKVTMYNTFTEKAILSINFIIIIVLSLFLGIGAEHVFILFINKINEVNIYSKHTQLIIALLISLMISLILFYKIIIKNDIKDDDLFFNIDKTKTLKDKIKAFLTLIVAVLVLILIPKVIERFYFDNPYKLGECNNYDSYMSDTRENFKLCVDKDKMMIINKEGKKRVHALFYVPPHAKVDINPDNIKDLIFNSNIIPEDMKHIFENMDIKMGKDVVFQPGTTPYIFKHIIIEVDEPIKNFKQQMIELAKAILGDEYSLPKDSKDAWVPKYTKYIHDFTTDEYFVGHIRLVLTNNRLSIYYPKDKVDKDKLVKLYNYINNYDGVSYISTTRDDKYKNIYEDLYDISNVKNKKRFLKDVLYKVWYYMGERDKPTY